MNWKDRFKGPTGGKRHPNILPLGAKGFNPLTHIHFTNPENGKTMVVDVKTGIAALAKLPDGPIRDALKTALDAWHAENGLTPPPQTADEVTNGSQ